MTTKTSQITAPKTCDRNDCTEPAVTDRKRNNFCAQHDAEWRRDIAHSNRVTWARKRRERRKAAAAASAANGSDSNDAPMPQHNGTLTTTRSHPSKSDLLKAYRSLDNAIWRTGWLNREQRFAASTTLAGLMTAILDEL